MVKKQIGIPLDDKSIIWRYLDFTKFVAVLETESLYFTRIDKLADPFEGATSKANIKNRPTVYKEIVESWPAFLEQTPRSNKAMRKFFLVNCWHMNEFESSAMWKIYLKTNEGIAIRTTIKNLSESFTQVDENNINIEAVRYIDYENDWLPEGNTIYPFIHKRKSFSFENEIRAIYSEFVTKEPEKEGEVGTLFLDKAIYEHGKNIKVDLNPD